MPRTSGLQTNFTSGELSPELDGRVDFQGYFNGAFKIENFYVKPQGSATKRKGLRFAGETKFSDKKTRIIKFVFSVLQSYILELGDNYMRFWTQQSRVLEDAVAITNVTTANPVVVTANSHGYTNGDGVVIKDVVGTTEVNNKEFVVANSTANTFQLQGIDGTSFTAYVSGGTVQKIHEISTPYTEDQLSDIKFAQTADLLYLVHPLHEVQKLTRVAVNNFSLAEVGFIGGPFAKENVVTTDILTLTGGSWNVDDTVTLTASGGHTPFESGHVGSYWKLRSGNDTAIVRVTGFTSSTIVTVQIKENAVPPSLQGVGVFTWSEGEWSDVKGFPAAIAFHEQRMVLARTVVEPQKRWFSKSGDFEVFTTGNEDDDGFDRTLAGDEINAIQWMVSDNVLLLGTLGEVWRDKSSGSALSNSDIDSKPQTRVNSSKIQALKVADIPIFIQRGLQGVQSVFFNFDIDKYKTDNLKVRSEHILESGAKEMAYQEEPDSLLWIVREDGEVAILSIERTPQVNAWSRLCTNGFFESVSIIPSEEGIVDEVWFVVKRTINGVEKRFIEYIDPTLGNSILNAYYVDSGLTYNGVQSQEVTLNTSTGSFNLTTENGEPLLTETGDNIVTEAQPDTATTTVPFFSIDDVGKEIHEINTPSDIPCAPDIIRKGRAIITQYISDTEVIIEFIEAFESTTLQAGTWGYAVKTVSGLNHLIGEQVVVSSDSRDTPVQTVDADGKVTIDNFSTIIHVGLAYPSTKLTTMRLEGGQAFGSSQGKLKRIDKIIIRVLETRGGSYINAVGKEQGILNRSLNNDMNRVTPFLSGDVELNFGDIWNRDGRIEIRSNEPQPMTIQSITYYVDTSDK